MAMISKTKPCSYVIVAMIITILTSKRKRMRTNTNSKARWTVAILFSCSIGAVDGGVVVVGIVVVVVIDIIE